MVISSSQSLFIILVCAVVTFFIRCLPFLLFNRGKNEAPKLILYLGNVLPTAVIAVLVIYCVKDSIFTDMSMFLPELIAIAVIAVLHITKKNYLISIGAGTLLYILLVNLVFVS